MRILHESADDLTILSPAITIRVAGACLLAMGLLFGLPIGIRLLGGWIPAFWGPAVAPLWGMPASLTMVIVAAMLCLTPVAGLFALLLARDTEYHFLGSQHVLSVRDGRKERQAIPFSEIVAAEDYADCDEGLPRYGLRLKLRGCFGRVLPISRGESRGWRRHRQILELAKRINQFLEAHGGEPQEASLGATYDIAQAFLETHRSEPQEAAANVKSEGPAALTDISAAPESKRSKTCPHCGGNLSVYAVKCRFCHANIE